MVRTLWKKKKKNEEISHRRGHYTPSLIHWHVLLVVKVTHLVVPLEEEVLTLPISIGVGGLTH